jgi:Protein of unknown function (DUF2971)
MISFAWRRDRDGSAQNVFRDFRFFSGSFTFQDDDLSEWRNNGDDGRGVVLSFRASAFNNPTVHIHNFIPDDQNAWVCPISYSSDELRSVIASIIEAWDRNSIGELCDHIFMISSMFKRDCWKPENEYRFFVHGIRQSILKRDCYKSRERNGEIVSYLDIPIQNWNSADDFPIYRIRLGPAASPRLDAHLADFLFSKCIASGIVRSNLPYRSVRTI